MEFIKVNPNNRTETIKLCNIIKKSIVDMYSELLKPEAIKYVFKFIIPKIKKREIMQDNYEYYLITTKVNNKNKLAGYVELVNTKEEFVLEKIYISKDYRNKKLGYNALLNVIKLAKKYNHQKIKLYINQNFSNVCETFTKWGFKQICPIARYIGSDYYLYEYYFEYCL